MKLSDKELADLIEETIPYCEVIGGGDGESALGCCDWQTEESINLQKRLRLAVNQLRNS